MLHNEPYRLDKTLSPERPFADVLKQTYTRMDGMDTKLRESIADAVARIAVDPTDGISWRGEGLIEDQTTLTVLIEASYSLSKAATLEDVLPAFEQFCERYKGYVISWAHQGETSSSTMSNIASRATLAATAKMFGSWGFAQELEREIKRDIEESRKRLVVVEFVDLKVDEWFRAEPDVAAMSYRKLSPRKAVEGVWPIADAKKLTFSPRDHVYVWRVPLESDVLYEAAA
ncbi:MAG TPA: hypothetical protein VL866_24355 [Pyrinomonadaceae bacterium]|nr:hypothetical protein [Pyrinomonadaceae bacterium]